MVARSITDPRKKRCSWQIDELDARTNPRRWLSRFAHLDLAVALTRTRPLYAPATYSHPVETGIVPIFVHTKNRDSNLRHCYMTKRENGQQS
jgi:hypothetical protein